MSAVPSTINAASTVKKPRHAYQFFLSLESGKKKVLPIQSSSSEGGSKTIQSISAEMGATWRQMSPEEKAPYFALAETAKRAFEQAVAEGSAAPPVKRKRSYTVTRESSRKKGKKVGINDMPKKPMTSYFYFLSDKKDEITASLDSTLWTGRTGRYLGLARNSAISKKASQIWKGMSEHEREPWTAKMDAAFVKYNSDKQAWEAAQIQRLCEPEPSSLGPRAPPSFPMSVLRLPTGEQSALLGPSLQTLSRAPSDMSLFELPEAKISPTYVVKEEPAFLIDEDATSFNERG